MFQLIRFQVPGQAESWGMQSDEGMRDLGRSFPEVGTLLEAIGQWDSLRPRIEAALKDAPLAPAGARLLCPVPPHGKTICIGLNYRDHALESGMDIPSEPVVFNKLPGALCGPNDEVPLPSCSSKVDYEAELVMVIGKRAWQVSEADAADYIFGYTCGHDVSARDWQLGRPGGQWLLGKSFPNFAPIGPAIVPSEFVPQPTNLPISLRINGETLQDSSTKQLIFNPNELVAFLSQCCVLEPGDVIFTGTPPGVGAARKPPRFLAAGDVVEVEIKGIGVLTNRFVPG
ncbi:fumarylacetoacetate hydrolase family protein [Aureliella helgolandensis]|uniref:Ureidoglycolate lyase n=1 Tax=Aureliella helgolandensis TaxID=2527968 RepID=A0A518G7N7_9BACT|nr:fumarylacetoacetate hydrolase family protein [Aureliella helgolandensis]QDV24599.1 Ureidoglycolate lyase [Aureliella helgolandensis]